MATLRRPIAALPIGRASSRIRRANHQAEGPQSRSIILLGAKCSPLAEQKNVTSQPDDWIYEAGGGTQPKRANS